MRKNSPRKNKRTVNSPRKNKLTVKSLPVFPEAIPPPPPQEKPVTDMDIDKECDRLVAEHLLHNRLVPKNQYDKAISLFEQTVETQKPECKQVFVKRRQKRMRNPLLSIRQIDLDNDENQHEYGFFLR